MSSSFLFEPAPVSAAAAATAIDRPSRELSSVSSMSQQNSRQSAQQLPEFRKSTPVKRSADDDGVSGLLASRLQRRKRLKRAPAIQTRIRRRSLPEKRRAALLEADDSGSDDEVMLSSTIKRLKVDSSDVLAEKSIANAPIDQYGSDTGDSNGRACDGVPGDSNSSVSAQLRHALSRRGPEILPDAVFREIESDMRHKSQCFAIVPYVDKQGTLLASAAPDSSPALDASAVEPIVQLNDQALISPSLTTMQLYGVPEITEEIALDESSSGMETDDDADGPEST